LLVSSSLVPMFIFATHRKNMNGCYKKLVRQPLVVTIVYY